MIVVKEPCFSHYHCISVSIKVLFLGRYLDTGRVISYFCTLNHTQKKESNWGWEIESELEQFSIFSAIKGLTLTPILGKSVTT